MLKYPNLGAEMVRRDLSDDTLARSIGVCVRSFQNKKAGRSPFTWPEVTTIRKQFFPDIPLDFLFATRADVQSSA